MSTKFLHQHPDLAARIRALAAQQSGSSEATHAQTVTGDNAIIAALRRRIREQERAHRDELVALRATIADQRRQIAVLYGQIRADTDG
ncbi:hypothetical protein ACMYYO_11120 [Dermacoccaceae bacterium W4C1]